MTVPSGSAATMPDPRADLHVASFDTEYVVWDPTCGLVHLLEGLHAVVFDACRSRIGRDELAAELVAAGIDTPAAQHEAQQAVDAALDHLRGLSMFADGGGRPP
ncbi:MAG: hypothetical protein ACOYMR_04470 [Ilumatobacteraceae bacterium]